MYICVVNTMRIKKITQGNFNFSTAIGPSNFIYENKLSYPSRFFISQTVH